MHTSAHLPTTALGEYTGTLLHGAEARTALIDGDGHSVPVLCLDLELDNPLRTHLHVEQPFPVGHGQQAVAAAQRLKKGMRVTVQAPLVGLRLVAPNTSHIHLHQAAT
ncbi:MAG: hypothetical protein Q7U28_08080 [Aquabacterium sp.]|nr:hypothetical protein [Aquabacterium sp.]